MTEQVSPTAELVKTVNEMSPEKQRAALRLFFRNAARAICVVRPDAAQVIAMVGGVLISQQQTMNYLQQWLAPFQAHQYIANDIEDLKILLENEGLEMNAGILPFMGEILPWLSEIATAALEGVAMCAPVALPTREG